VSATPRQKAQESSHPADATAMALLTEVRNRIGPVYGSETISLLLYALARRERPRNVLELGTGLGVSASMIAQALKENGAGRIWTIDDGSHWQDRAKLAQAIAPLRGVAGLGSPDVGALDYPGFVSAMTKSLGVGGHLTFLHERLDLGVDVDFTSARWPFLAEPIDMVFLDINHTPEPILDTLYYVLPHAAPCLSLFVDPASPARSATCSSRRWSSGSTAARCRGAGCSAPTWRRAACWSTWWRRGASPWSTWSSG